MTSSAPFPFAEAPQTEKHPHSDTHHGITRTDDYAWLRADNWQEVFRDPTVLDPRIRAHLEAENAYQAKLMADTADLQKALFGEMKGRIKEDDSSVPMKDGPYAYGSSFRLGGEQPRYFRTPRDGGEEHILLDGDADGVVPQVRVRLHVIHSAVPGTSGDPPRGCPRGPANLANSQERGWGQPM